MTKKLIFLFVLLGVILFLMIGRINYLDEQSLAEIERQADIKRIEMGLK